ncbi:MAG: ABC transporter permease [Actinomycetota bacterium]|nr:ABC transporter permease [Actinomycetota bacterium]
MGDGVGNYVDVFTRSSTRRAMIITLFSAGIVTILALAAGSVLAWHLCTVRSRLAKALIWIAVLAPFWMGTVVKNYVVILILGREGPANDTLAAVGLPRVDMIYTTQAVISGMTYTMIPFAVFSLFGVLRGIDQTLPLAAQSMGASRLVALRTTVLPIAAPGVLASGGLVFAISVGFYITPVLLGGGQTPFMATVISSNIFGYYNYGFAAAASVVLLLVALLVLAFAFLAVGRERLLRAVA